MRRRKPLPKVCHHHRAVAQSNPHSTAVRGVGANASAIARPQSTAGPRACAANRPSACTAAASLWLRQRRHFPTWMRSNPAPTHAKRLAALGAVASAGVHRPAAGCGGPARWMASAAAHRFGAVPRPVHGWPMWLCPAGRQPAPGWGVAPKALTRLTGGAGFFCGQGLHGSRHHGVGLRGSHRGAGSHLRLAPLGRWLLQTVWRWCGRRGL